MRLVVMVVVLLRLRVGPDAWEAGMGHSMELESARHNPRHTHTVSRSVSTAIEVGPGLTARWREAQQQWARWHAGAGRRRTRPPRRWWAGCPGCKGRASTSVENVRLASPATG